MNVEDISKKYYEMDQLTALGTLIEVTSQATIAVDRAVQDTEKLYDQADSNGSLEPAHSVVGPEAWSAYHSLRAIQRALVLGKPTQEREAVRDFYNQGVDFYRLDLRNNIKELIEKVYYAHAAALKNSK
jgi:hypothetical protein